MRKLTLILVPVLALLLTAPLRAESKFKVDPGHSAVVFKVMHLGVGHVWGRFNDPAGTIVWDEQDPSKSKFEVTLQTSKVDTGNAGRDRHLRLPDFFDAAKFPTITFKSTAISKSSDDSYEMVGDLSLHGVTKSITVPLKKIGEGDRGERFGHRIGFEATFTIKRSEFGMNYMPEGIGDDVSVIVNLEAPRT